eukprot:4658062-Prymnesium_polylepis.1
MATRAAIFLQRLQQSLLVKIKILVTTVQVLSGLKDSFDVMQPQIMVSFNNAFAILEINPFKQLPIACTISLNQYEQVIVRTAVLVAVIGGLFVSQQVANQLPTWQNRAMWVLRNADTVWFIVLFLMYPGLMTAIFAIFPCQTFDNGESYLQADYSISCDAHDRS